ncbi:MAG: hypothetical protein JO270_23955 [Acidobacteriaceae bacterium]|nr:hypothetical protein [Acidobacteriaceae bacterium]MBV8570880.1 hypothetical protein [Acidobacteriaceae bacterium]
MLVGLPELSGRPIFVSVGSQLTAHGGKLLSGSPDRGTQIHAASFVHDRHIVLDSYLLSRPYLLRLILVHEIFHFVWPRLGNPARAAYEELVSVERDCGARGELGESAALSKLSLKAAANCTNDNRRVRWRDYICESFCDTAAWLYAGVGRHREFTLGQRWRDRRTEWFRTVFSQGRGC